MVVIRVETGNTYDLILGTFNADLVTSASVGRELQLRCRYWAFGGVKVKLI